MTWWKDIDINLSKKHNGDIKDFENEFAIMESLRNIFHTIQGERRRLPEFAFNLYELLFEPIDDITAREIGEMMLEVIDRWEDGIIAKDLLVRPMPDQGRYDIKFTFQIRGSAAPNPYTLEDTIQAA